MYEIWNDKQGNRYEMRAVHPTDRELFVEAFKVCTYVFTLVLSLAHSTSMLYYMNIHVCVALFLVLVHIIQNLSEDSIQKRFFTYKTELSEDVCQCS